MSDADQAQIFTDLLEALATVRVLTTALASERALADELAQALDEVVTFTDDDPATMRAAAAYTRWRETTGQTDLDAERALADELGRVIGELLVERSFISDAEATLARYEAAREDR